MAIDKETEAFDEEALAREFEGAEDATPEEEVLEQVSTLLSPMDYIKTLHQTLDHPTFRQLPAHQQILYLQCLRHGQGEGKSRVRATIAQMAQWIGRTSKNVFQTRKQLVKAGLLRMTVKPRQFSTGQFEVKLLQPLVGSRLSPMEMAHRLDPFTAEDLVVLDQQIRTMDAKDRRELHEEVEQTCLDLQKSGFVLPDGTREKVFQYLAYIRLTGKWRIHSRFPDWTDY